MEYRVKNGVYYVSLGGAFPAGAKPALRPASPLVILVRRDPVHSRGFWAITDLGQLTEPEGPAALLPRRTPADAPQDLAEFVRAHGASVLNTAFPGGFDFADRWFGPKPERYKVTLVGLGDVGGTVLTGLKLLGQEIEEIQIFDYNEAQCKRYAMELNQVLPLSPDRPMPRITVCREDQLFHCDLFLFTASRGVPPVGQEGGDVRMAQYEANRAMLAAYARRARAAQFQGIFCQISDPVDLLARAVYLESNRGEAGHYDWQGLLPEQVQGFGLGVMNARAAYYAKRDGRFASFLTEGRSFGPHGTGLTIANSIEHYDDALSQELTQLTVTANLKMREIGFKPYVAPALSSGALSLLLTLRGEWHCGSVFLDGIYMGVKNRYTPAGIETEVLPHIPDALFGHIRDAAEHLKEVL